MDCSSSHSKDCAGGHTANSGIVARILLRTIRLYQLILSPWLGQQCRFHPTCSSYACDAIEYHGAWRGSVLTLRRLLRCHPWHEGGIDFAPPVYRDKN